RTGDLARLDEDGFFYICGRLKRFAKLFGRRINLEDIEHELEATFPVRVIAMDSGDHLTVFAEGMEGMEEAPVRLHLPHNFDIPPKAITITPVAALPMTTNGKKDYRATAQFQAAVSSGIK